MVSKSLVLAYHGCDRDLAHQVVCGNQQLLPSENAYDWLGHGIYFWEDSPSRALKWAREEGREHKSSQPGILGAVIDLGNCLNLADAEALSAVKAAHQIYIEICRASGAEQARNRGLDLGARFLDCAVMETLHKLQTEQGFPPFDTVRGFFTEGKELYPASGFRELDHIQICVRSPKKILGYFLPRIP